jgi:hypothetical protein
LAQFTDPEKPNQALRVASAVACAATVTTGEMGADLKAPACVAVGRGTDIRLNIAQNAIFHFMQLDISFYAVDISFYGVPHKAA